MEKARIHKGFEIAYKAVAEELLNKVEDLLQKNKRPVYLTGHSLGGVLATVCSLDLLLSGVVSGSFFVTVTTFGSPCGNISWVKMYNKAVPSHWRIIIGSDAVTMMPKVGYGHVGKTALLTSEGLLLLDPSALDTCFKTVKPSINNLKNLADKMALTVACFKT